MNVSTSPFTGISLHKIESIYVLQVEKNLAFIFFLFHTLRREQFYSEIYNFKVYLNTIGLLYTVVITLSVKGAC